MAFYIAFGIIFVRAKRGPDYTKIIFVRPLILIYSSEYNHHFVVIIVARNRILRIERNCASHVSKESMTSLALENSKCQRTIKMNNVKSK